MADKASLITTDLCRTAALSAAVIYAALVAGEFFRLDLELRLWVNTASRIIVQKKIRFSEFFYHIISIGSKFLFAVFYLLYLLANGLSHSLLRL